jgi:hypothetical protein
MRPVITPKNDQDVIVRILLELNQTTRSINVQKEKAKVIEKSILPRIDLLLDTTNIPMIIAITADGMWVYKIKLTGA